MLVMLVNLKTVLSVVSLVCGAVGSENVYNSSDWSVDGKSLQMLANRSTPSSKSRRQMYTELMDKLFKDYNPVVPPDTGDADKALNITMMMVLQNLVFLDMKSQTLSIIAWFQIEWPDLAFSWDMDVYPVDMIVVSEKDVWRPLLAIANTLLPRDQIMKIELPVSIYADGTVRWFPGDSLLIDCHVDLRFYPFDVQTCKVQVTQWSHQAHHFLCSGMDIRSSVTGNGEWDVVDIDYELEVVQEPDYKYWMVNYRFTLKRKWMFYVINLIFPIILVSVLNNVVFILPVGSGDKMSVSVTAFLTLIVFLTLIQDELAKNSDTVCYLTLYLSVQMMLGALAIVQSAIVVAFHHKSLHDNTAHDDDYDQHNISFKGKWVSAFDTFLNDGLWDPRELEQKEDHMTKEDDHRPQSRYMDYQPRQTPEYQPRQTPVWTVREKNGRRIFFKLRRDGDREKGSYSTGVGWNGVAGRIDSVCFPVFLILNALSLLVFCVIIGIA